MIKRFLFSALIFLFSASSAFPWQINCFPEGNLFTGEQKQITLNLVFVPLNHQNESEFKKDVSSIIARLKGTAPFDEFKGIKVNLLDADLKEKDVLFKKSETFPFLEVRNDLIQGINRRIGDVYKLVILSKKGDSSAAELSGIEDVSLIMLGKSSYGRKNRLAKAFLHELGHSLGLREENSGSSRLIIPGPPNCAPDKESAVKWWGDMVEEKSGVGYFEIHSQDGKFIKPTRRSIMNNPFKSSGYGSVNERYLRKELGLEELKD